MIILATFSFKYSLRFCTQIPDKYCLQGKEAWWSLKIIIQTGRPHLLIVSPQLISYDISYQFVFSTHVHCTWSSSLFAFSRIQNRVDGIHWEGEDMINAWDTNLHKFSQRAEWLFYSFRRINTSTKSQIEICFHVRVCTFRSEEPVVEASDSWFITQALRAGLRRITKVS